ncbi:MAG: nucleotidyltransferase family protein [Egibacteraceae bacterium]
MEDARWRYFLSQVDQHRLSGLLLHAIASQALPATREQARGARQLHARATGGVLLREAGLLEAVEALNRAGIASRALNGAATARFAYPDPAARPYRDVGVLVPQAQLHTALHVLMALGYQRGSPTLRPGFDETFGMAVTLSRADGMSINLHRNLISGPFGLTIPLDSLFHDATVFSVGSRPIMALPPEAHFLHSCYQAALGVPPRLVRLRDVAQHVLADMLNTDRVLEMARAWAAEGALAFAVRLSWERLALSDAVPLSVWAHRYTPSRREQRFLAGYRSRRYAHRALDTLQAIEGVGSKAAFMRALVLPDPAWLAHHGQHRLRWLGRGLSSVVCSRRRP